MNNFSQGRREEAQMIMQLMMKTVVDQPFRGQFTLPGQPIFIADAGREATHAYLAQGIGAACEAWGAKALDVLADQSPDADEAPSEILLIGAAMPASDVMDANTQEAQMAEACAEVIRVLLAGAIISAKEDCEGKDQVYALFMGMPDFVAEPDFVHHTLTVMARTHAKVIREHNPGVSYVLGNTIGKPAKQLAWSIPVVDLFYGQRRIRWLDERSPGHWEHEQVAKVMA